MILCALFACKKEKPELSNYYCNTGSMFVLNEGAFGSANASVDFYNTQTDTIIENVFNLQTEGFLGDVAQSIQKVDDRIYIVVNNSSTIKCIDACSFELIGEITGLNSPRYLLPITTSKAYVSDLFNTTLSIVNLQTFTVDSVIPIGSNSEHMLLKDKTAYVSAPDNHKIYLLDVNSDQITDSISTLPYPSYLAFDNTQNIWVFCAGTTWPSTVNGGMQAYNLNDLTLSFSEELPPSYPAKMAFNDDFSALYFTHNGVEKLSLSSENIDPFISASEFMFLYGLDVHQNHVYLTDAKDFNSQGEVVVFDENKTKVSSFKTGIAPNSFVFF